MESGTCEPLIDPEKAAQLLGCSERQIKRMAAENEVPALRVGNRWKFRASALDEWMRKQLSVYGIGANTGSSTKKPPTSPERKIDE
jgi:excisionase family DNA binding protein